MFSSEKTCLMSVDGNRFPDIGKVVQGFLLRSDLDNHSLLFNRLHLYITYTCRGIRSS